MSDEREPPERVFVHPGRIVDGVYDQTWTEAPPSILAGGVPYLRADKPRFYVVEDEDGEVQDTYGSVQWLRDAWRGDIEENGWTIHPVYIGPAIEPEEVTDE